MSNFLSDWIESEREKYNQLSWWKKHNWIFKIVGFLLLLVTIGFLIGRYV